jgi:hypothetical protein
MTNVTNKGSKLALARWLVLRAVGLTFAVAVLLAVVGALFESSSDADFAPAHPGAWFAAYHSVLGAILFVLLAPMWLLDYFRLTSHDAICYLFSSACYGVLFSFVWFAVARFRRKSHATRSA